ncbi:MAG: DUF3906 family protein [Bacilli bacterium]
MELYRFIVEAKEQGEFPVIIVASGEEEAFRLLDIELEKHFVRTPELTDVTLYEKRRVGKGTGYVLAPRIFGE